MRATIAIAIGLLCICMVAVAGDNRQDSPERPANLSVSTDLNYGAAMHTTGKLKISVDNYGTFATDESGYLLSPYTDWFTGEPITACEFPDGSGHRYCWAGALWIGAVVDGDTLVSVAADGWQYGREMNPLPGTTLEYRSTIASDSALRVGARSEEDIIGQYTDSFTTGVSHLQDDVIDHRPHRPLNVVVTHTSYSWSAPQVEDLIIVAYTIRNAGSDTLRDAYVGLYVDADVTGEALSPDGTFDDLSGFRSVSRIDGLSGCTLPTSSELPIAWIADNDGDMGQSNSCTGVSGVALLQAPPTANRTSFNWWVSNTNASLDFGPRTLGHLRDFSTGGTGTPEGDRNKYFLMSNGETDYDQAYVASISQSDPNWEYPTNRQLVDAISRGYDARYLLSVGPFDLLPGEEVPLVFAYVAGENLHHIAGNLANLPNDPATYEANLDFGDLEENVRAAARTYDTPGIDTDQDGYAGEFVLCGSDTVYVTGDGVPDLDPIIGCGVGRTGNVDGDASDQITLSDLSLLIAYMTQPGIILDCPSEANVDGKGRIDLTDLSALILYLTTPGSFQLPWCK